MANAQQTTLEQPGKRSIDVTGLSDDAIRAVEVLVAELRGQRLADLRREIAIGIEQAHKGQVAPLEARETLARVRKERQASTGR